MKVPSRVKYDAVVIGKMLRTCQRGLLKVPSRVKYDAVVIGKMLRTCRRGFTVTFFSVCCWTAEMLIVLATSSPKRRWLFADRHGVVTQTTRIIIFAVVRTWGVSQNASCIRWTYEWRGSCCMLMLLQHAVRQHSSGILCSPISCEGNTDRRHLTTGIRSEKCVVRRFRLCANVIECEERRPKRCNN